MTGSKRRTATDPTESSGNDNRNRIRDLCWTNAVHAFGTSHIFQRRALQLRRQLIWLNYVGVAVPFTIGVLALTFGGLGALDVIIVVGGVLLVPQAVI